MADSEPRQLRIRMYDIGFGDCFLFFLPGEERERLLLVDFGRHLSSKHGNTLSKIADDLTKVARAHAPEGESGPWFDVVVATHRHYDHIAGFDLKKAKEFRAGEVWMPWTEDPDDDEAADLRNAQFALGEALDEVLSEAGRSASLDAARDLVANSNHKTCNFELSNDGAMGNLLNGLANGAPRRFLSQHREPTGEQGSLVDTFESAALPDVKIHVLGPSRHPDVIASLKPPKGEYFELDGDQVVVRSVGSRPPLFARPYVVSRNRRRSEEDIAQFEQLQARAFDAVFAAKQLEDMVNGTSLVLALEIGETVVILGGDAEWGTWETMLDDPVGRSLLERTSVYKVSHHGSYNGTPRRYVEELMPKNAISLLSLCPMEQWPSIPRTSLLDDLEAHDRTLVRTDQPPPGDNPLYTELVVDIAT